jgi:hypothetical protein
MLGPVEVWNGTHSRLLFAKLKSRKENFDAATDHSSAAVVRGRRILRVFQVGERRRLRNSREVVLIALILYFLGVLP